MGEVVLPAELALTKTFFDILVSSDPYADGSIVPEVAAVLTGVDEAESGVVARSYGAAVAAVGSDLPRQRLAVEAAVQLDLFEVLDDILVALERFADPHLLNAAAALAGNPSASPEARSRMRRLVESSALHSDVLALVKVRAGLQEAQTDAERMVEAQMWPGRASRETLAQFAPIVYVASTEAPRDAYWRAIGALATSGARVRRFAGTEGMARSREWANRFSPLVAWTGNAKIVWLRETEHRSNPLVVADASLQSSLSLPRLLAQVTSALPSGWTLRAPQRATAALDEIPQFAPEVLREGAFDQLEMMYLGAAGKDVIRRLSKEALVPRDTDRNRWSFDQLVTLRLVQSFKTIRSGRMDAKKVLGRIHEIASASVERDIALDANGNMYVSDGEGGFQTLDSGQEAIPDVLSIDVAFQPFKIGGGQIPDLLTPSSRTVVNPQVLNGTPTIRGTRISARSVYHVFGSGEAALRSAYPELDAIAIREAQKVGAAILSRREVS